MLQQGKLSGFRFEYVDAASVRSDPQFILAFGKAEYDVVAQG